MTLRRAFAVLRETFCAITAERTCKCPTASRSTLQVEQHLAFRRKLGVVERRAEAGFVGDRREAVFAGVAGGDEGFGGERGVVGGADVGGGSGDVGVACCR